MGQHVATRENTCVTFNLHYLRSQSARGRVKLWQSWVLVGDWNRISHRNVERAIMVQWSMHQSAVCMGNSQQAISATNMLLLPNAIRKHNRKSRWTNQTTTKPQLANQPTHSSVQRQWRYWICGFNYIILYVLHPVQPLPAMAPCMASHACTMLSICSRCRLQER